MDFGWWIVHFATMSTPLDGVVMQQLVAEAQQYLTAGGADVPASIRCEPCDEQPTAGKLAGVHAALAAVEKEASILGQQLYPLRSPGEVAAVLEAQLVFPAGTPHRARRMLEELRLRDINVSTEFEVTQLLQATELQSVGGRASRRWSRGFQCIHRSHNRASWIRGPAFRLHDTDTNRGLWLTLA